MNNFFKNIWAHTSIIFFLIIVFLLLYMKSCMKCPPCPVCPEIKQSHFQGKKELGTVITADTADIKYSLSKEVGRNSDAPHKLTSKSDVGITAAPTQEKSAFVCDEPVLAELVIKDTICIDSLSIKVKNNRIQSFLSRRNYLLPFSSDSTIQFIDRPVHKNTFTLGTFTSKYSSGAVIGYRTNRVHGAIGYDLVNSSPIIQLNYDLK